MRYSAIWLRPGLTIRAVQSTSTARGYHQTWYEVTSGGAITSATFEALSKDGVFGSGQDYEVTGPEMSQIDVLPMAVAQDGSYYLPDEHHVPLRWDDRVVTEAQSFPLYTYTVRRICDSGD